MTRSPDWRSIVLCALMLFLNNGLMLIGVSAFDPALLAALHVSIAALKLGDSLTLLTLALASPFAGWALDRIGPARCFGGGALCMAAGMGLFAAGAGHALWVFYAAHFLFGLCLALCGAFASALVVASVSGDRLGAGMGVLLAANSAGLAFGIGLMQALAGPFGWQRAVMVAAFAALMMVKPLVRGLPHDLAAHRPAQAGATLPDAMRTGRFWGVALIAAASFFVEMGLLTNFVVFAARDLGVAGASIGALMLAMFASGIAAHLVAGALADRVDRRLVHGAGIVLMIAGLLAFARAALDESPAGVLGVAILYGAGWGASYVVLQLLLTTSFPGAQNGRIVGVIGAIESVGAGVAPFAVGLLRDHYASYASALVLLAGLMAVVLVGQWRLAPLRGATAGGVSS